MRIIVFANKLNYYYYFLFHHFELRGQNFSQLGTFSSPRTLLHDDFPAKFSLSVPVPVSLSSPSHPLPSEAGTVRRITPPALFLAVRYNADRQAGPWRQRAVTERPHRASGHVTCVARLVGPVHSREDRACKRSQTLEHIHPPPWEKSFTFRLASAATRLEPRYVSLLNFKP